MNEALGPQEAVILELWGVRDRPGQWTEGAEAWGRCQD